MSISCVTTRPYANFRTNRTLNIVLEPRNVLVSNTDDGLCFELAWEGAISLEVPVQPAKRRVGHFILDHAIEACPADCCGQSPVGLEDVERSQELAAKIVPGSGDHELGGQNSDLWSLGCIFMEAAAWAVGHSKFIDGCEGGGLSPGKASADPGHQDIRPEKRRVHWPPLWAANYNLADTVEAELTLKARQDGDFVVLALLPIIKKMLNPPEERPNALQVDRMLREAISKIASEPRKEISVEQVIEWINDRKRSPFIRKFVFTDSTNRTSVPGQLTERDTIAALVDGMKDRHHVSPKYPGDQRDRFPGWRA